MHVAFMSWNRVAAVLGVLILLVGSALAQGGRRGAMVDSEYVSDADLAALAGHEANVVRWQVFWDGTPGDRDVEIARLQQRMPFLSAHGLRVVVDLHQAPAGLLGSTTGRAAFRTFWRTFATAFNNNEDVWGFDLLNEPPYNHSVWRPVVEETIVAIRNQDSDRRIIVQPRLGDPDRLQNMTPLPYNRIVYSVHVYLPLRYTHQHVCEPCACGYEPAGASPAYPGLIGGVQWNLAKLRDRLRPVRDYQLEHDVPIFVGEFSAARWAPGAEQYLADCITAFEGWGWHWCYHAWREASVWDAEMSSTTPCDFTRYPTTPRLEVLRAGWMLNQ